MKLFQKLRSTTIPVDNNSNIIMASGYASIPSDWIILNPNDAPVSHYICVLECRNYAKLHIPHFVYFTNIETPHEYTDEFRDSLYLLCKQHWKNFEKSVLQKQVLPEFSDPKMPGRITNIDDFESAPNIGLFSVPFVTNNNECYNHPWNIAIISPTVSKSRPMTS